MRPRSPERANARRPRARLEETRATDGSRDVDWAASCSDRQVAARKAQRKHQNRGIGGRRRAALVADDDSAAAVTDRDLEARADRQQSKISLLGPVIVPRSRAAGTAAKAIGR